MVESSIPSSRVPIEASKPWDASGGEAAGERLITIGVARIEETGRYGSVEFDESGRVTAFLEKADRESGWINTGIYCVSRAALAVIEPDRNVSIETDIFPALTGCSQLGVLKVDPPMLDMGTPEGLKEMEQHLAANQRASSIA